MFFFFADNPALCSSQEADWC